MGYRVSAGSHKFMHGMTCIELADDKEPTFSLLDPKDPYKGVRIVYQRGAREDRLTEADMPEEWRDSGKGMGFRLSSDQASKFVRILTPCHDKERVLTYDIICAPRIVSSGPMNIHEDNEQCHLNVTWTSRYGCPLSELEKSFGFFRGIAGRQWHRREGLGFSEVGGVYIVLILTVTCCLPFICQQMMSRHHQIPGIDTRKAAGIRSSSSVMAASDDEARGKKKQFMSKASRRRLQ
mmetsp:Transcript_19829/g.35371  ORF Transcript_19829/g.35371 Transcript_19829/m.35371 type:complete len:236 (+) Transcript_19829:58-765(+)